MEELYEWYILFGELLCDNVVFGECFWFLWFGFIYFKCMFGFIVEIDEIGNVGLYLICYFVLGDLSLCFRVVKIVKMILV